MVKSSTADYVAHLDDDDIVDETYISSILPLLDGVDYVGHILQCYIDGVPLPKKTYHSLMYDGWYEDEGGYRRDISHINPMRRELAILEPFEGGMGEDQRWADRMRKRQVLKTEHFIPRTLYHYYFRTRKNRAGNCPACQSESTVLVETGSHCNCCGASFNPVPQRKSCLWA